MPSSSTSTRSSKVPSSSSRTAAQPQVKTPAVPLKCYLSAQYQSRGVMEVNTPCDSKGRQEGLPRRSDLTNTHRTMRLGLGTPMNNIKASHIVNAKKTTPLAIPIRKIVLGCRKSRVQNQNKSDSSTASLTTQMKKLAIYSSPTGDEEKPTSVFDTLFKHIDKKANDIARGKITEFNFDGTVVVVPKKIVVAPEESSKEDAESIPNLCKRLRTFFGWKMSLHLRWKYVEERVDKWPNNISPVSVNDVANLLKISPDQVKQFEIVPELKQIFDVLRKNICHVNTPNIAKLLALSELQKGNLSAAASYLSESQGMFLHSDIIDKHLNYIRRNEESSSQDSPRSKEESERESFKTSLFSTQIKDTLEFSDQFFTPNGESELIKKLSSFDPNWNIVQITTSVHSANRFSHELIGKNQVPQLMLSAFCQVPGDKVKSQFTAFCEAPPVDSGSMMRHGLIEEFQRVLDKNLAISDEWMVISRKKYWEERAKHNESMECIMYAMEDWLNPWAFLLPGRINDQTIQDMIEKEVLSDRYLKKATSSQRLIITRLTENFTKLSVTAKLTLDTLVAHVLKVDEEIAHGIVRKIEEVGFCIYADAPRHPTILILDQKIDILPWDWLPCLRNTDVTRMPSLNLINSSLKMCRSIKNDYPVIVDPEKCTFILNPDGTLPNVQQRMEDYLTGRKEWVPIIARPPTTQEMQDALENQDILLYCGHGAGSNYYPEYAVQKLVCKAVPLLMGCSSAQSHFTGPRHCPNSVVNTYFIAGCSSMVGFLWEVTDTECDRVTVDFLERWLPNPSLKPPKMPFFDRESKRDKEQYLPTALRKSRAAATQFLTQCAAVCYGLPAATYDSDL